MPVEAIGWRSPGKVLVVVPLGVRMTAAKQYVCMTVRVLIGTMVLALAISACDGGSSGPTSHSAKGTTTPRSIRPLPRGSGAGKLPSFSLPSQEAIKELGTNGGGYFNVRFRSLRKCPAPVRETTTTGTLPAAARIAVKTSGSIRGTLDCIP